MTKLLRWIFSGIVALGVLFILFLIKGKFLLLSIITWPLVLTLSALAIAGVISKFKNRVILQFKEKHDLALLENVNGDVYAIRKKTSGESIFIFSYVDENGNKILLTELYENVIVVKKEVERPYMKVYNNVYKPKGFLDNLYYTDNAPNNIESIYKLYLPDDIIIR